MTVNETRPNRQTLIGVGTIVGLCASALLVLYIADPARHSLYPVCYFHQLTGLDCPGCGSQRAIHQLLHGNLLLAFRLNPLLILSLPLLAFWATRGVLLATKGDRSAFAVPPRWFGWFVAVMIVFGVVRNLPIAFLHPG